MFIYEKIMPNGAMTKYHKAIRFEIHSDATHAVVNSYHLETMDMISWQDTYTIPIIFKIESLADVEAVLTASGSPFEGGTIVSSSGDLEALRARLKASVKIKRDAAIAAGVNTPYGVVDSDPASQAKLFSTAVTNSILKSDTTVGWRMKDNTVVTLNTAMLLEICSLVNAHVSFCQANKNRLDDLIVAATTLEELNAINLESGWTE